MTGGCGKEKLCSAIMSFSPFDRAPCGLSVLPVPPPRGCRTARRIVSSCATERYAGRATRYKPVPFDASVALNTANMSQSGPSLRLPQCKITEALRSQADTGVLGQQGRCYGLSGRSVHLRTLLNNRFTFGLRLDQIP